MLLTIRYEIARDSERRIEEMTEQKINFLNLDFFFFEKLVIWMWGPIDPRGTIQVERVGPMAQ